MHNMQEVCILGPRTRCALLGSRALSKCQMKTPLIHPVLRLNDMGCKWEGGTHTKEDDSKETPVEQNRWCG